MKNKSKKKIKKNKKTKKKIFFKSGSNNLNSELERLESLRINLLNFYRDNDIRNDILDYVLSNNNDFFIYQLTPYQCFGCSSNNSNNYQVNKNPLFSGSRLNLIRHLEIGFSNDIFHKKWNKYNLSNIESNTSTSYIENNNFQLKRDFKRNTGYFINNDTDKEIIIYNDNINNLSNNVNFNNIEYEKNVNAYLIDFFNKNVEYPIPNINRIINAYKIFTRQTFFNYIPWFLLTLVKLDNSNMSVFLGDVKIQIIDGEYSRVLTVIDIITVNTSDGEKNLIGHCIGVIDTTKPYYKAKTILFFHNNVELQYNNLKSLPNLSTYTEYNENFEIIPENQIKKTSLLNRIKTYISGIA